MGSEAGVRMSPCEREDVGSEAHHVQDLKSSAMQHFSSQLAMMAHTVRACRFIVAQYAKAVSETTGRLQGDEPVSRIVLGTD
jgi:hypothetical protein